MKKNLKVNADLNKNLKGNYLEIIKEKLILHPDIYDCEVFLNNGEVYAFYVENQFVSYYQLNKYLSENISENLPVIHMININYMLYTESGEVNKDALINTDFIDSQKIKKLEDELQTFKLDDYCIIQTFEKKIKEIKLKKNKAGSVNGNDYELTELINENKDAIIIANELVVDNDEPVDLVELIEQASKCNEKLIYIEENGEVKEESYQDLFIRAKKIAGGLKQYGCCKKDKIIFQFTKIYDFIGAFWGAALTGLIPVPLAASYDYTEKNSETDKLINIWEFLDKPLIISSDDIYKDINKLGTVFDIKDLKVLSINNIENNEEINTISKPENPGDLALLVFTSGSTGHPKGVMLNHKNLLSRSKGSKVLNNFTKDDISLNWMPLEHVGGIIYFHIRDVYLKSKQIHVSKKIILNNPLLWLDLLSKYRVTVTWAPNFAYGLIEKYENEINKKDWDFSNLKKILNGGEAVSSKTTNKFIKLLKKFKLSENSIVPVYGMSETSSGITYSYSYNNHNIKTKNKFVSVGKPIPGVSLRIVDDDNNLLKEGEIGNLQITGNTITSGYYNNEELTKESFTNKWFITGDLAFIKNDELTITGRAKDMIIINGINYYTQEIESIIENIPEIENSFTAACAIKENNADTDKCAVFYNIPDFDSMENLENEIEIITEKLQDLHKKINLEVVRSCGLSPAYLIPLKKNEFPKTDIGKIQRSKLKKQFEEGAYEARLKKIGVKTGNNTIIPNWFYTKKWVNQKVVMPLEKIINPKIILIGDDQLDNIYSLLQKKDINIICVKNGSEYKKINDLEYEIRLSEEKDYEILFKEFFNNNIEYNCIINVFPVNKSIEINEKKLMDTTIRLLSPVKYNSSEKHFKYLVFTQNAFVLNDDTEFNINLAHVQGILKSIGQEYKNISACQLDIDSIDSLVEIIPDEFYSLRNDQDVAYRSGNRYVSKLEEPECKEANFTFDNISDEDYILVTGGLGGIGYHICHWLLKDYELNLVVVGRTKINDLKDERKIRLDSLNSLAGNVFYISADVSDYKTLLGEVENFEKKENLKLKYIFHLAGSLGVSEKGFYWDEIENHLINREMFSSYKTVFQTKIIGTGNLQKLREKDNEIGLVLFSSVNGYFGGVSLSAYAGGNSFLDSYCEYLQKNHPLTYCFNWSMWKDVGLSESVPKMVKEMLSENGYELIDIIQGINSIIYCMKNTINNVYIGLNSFNFAKRRLVATGLYPVLNLIYTGNKISGQIPSEIINKIQDTLTDKNKDNYDIKLINAAEIPRKSNEKSDIDFKLLFSKYIINDKSNEDFNNQNRKPATQIEEKIVSIWESVLGISNISVNDNFFQLGGDSISSVKIIDKMKDTGLKVKLTMMDFIKHPTIADLYKNILQSETIDSNYDENQSKTPYDNKIQNDKLPIDNIPDHKILKIDTNHKISTYLHRSLPLFAVLGNENYYPWFYENYVNVFSRTSPTGYLNIDYLEYEYPFQHMFYYSFLGFKIADSIDDIISFIKNMIHSDNYVIVVSDDYYLSNSVFYKKDHIIHEQLIYGYDNKTKSFNTVGFNKDWILTTGSVSYDEMLSSIENCRHHYEKRAPWAADKTIQILVPKSNDIDTPYRFSLNNFLNNLSDYLNSTENYSIIYSLNFMNDKVSFGLNIYDDIMEHLENLKIGKITMDYRVVHLLHEHKKLMVDRLEYIKEKFNLPIEFNGFIEPLKMIVNKLNYLKMTYIKFQENLMSFSNKFEEIEKRIEDGIPPELAKYGDLLSDTKNDLTLLKNNEKELFTSIYNYLSNIPR